MRLGYARVSTADQNLDLQRDALKAAGCERLYCDVGSGVRTDRPALERLLADIQPGDVLVVWKLDRLGRSLAHLIQTVADLGKRGCDFFSVSDTLDTRTPVGRLTFHLMGAFAEFERAQMLERTAAGLAAARARGVRFGRPRVLSREKLRQARVLVGGGERVRDVARSMGVSAATLYRELAVSSGPAG